MDELALTGSEKLQVSLSLSMYTDGTCPAAPRRSSDVGWSQRRRRIIYILGIVDPIDKGGFDDAPGDDQREFEFGLDLILDTLARHAD